MQNIYADGTYLERHRTWGAEDSPWKADQIARILDRNEVRPSTIAEVGCGAGVVLKELADRYPEAALRGYDISPQAHALARQHSSRRLSFHLEDPLEASNVERFDLLLAIDVFEHVPDYMGFLNKCQRKADLKLYHVPLDLHVSALLRDRQLHARATVGHLHYFSAATALATLRDTGHEIVDHFYTASTLALFKHHRNARTAFANGPRWLLSKFSQTLAQKLLGGFSLMVLCR